MTPTPRTIPYPVVCELMCSSPPPITFPSLEHMPTYIPHPRLCSNVVRFSWSGAYRCATIPLKILAEPRFAIGRPERPPTRTHTDGTPRRRSQRRCTLSHHRSYRQCARGFARSGLDVSATERVAHPDSSRHAYTNGHPI